MSPTKRALDALSACHRVQLHNPTQAYELECSCGWLWRGPLRSAIEAYGSHVAERALDSAQAEPRVTFWFDAGWDELE